ARSLKMPYPSLLALGGVVLAFVPDSPVFALDPALTLALFVAPVLLDAAFDTSLRDLKRSWVPVTCLVFVAVGITTVAVAWLVRQFVPDMPWAAAIALGAIVAPPDAAAASAILRNLQIPHRMIVILEGESLLNDATALLIYRIAVGVAMGAAFTPGTAALQGLAMLLSVPAGILLAHLSTRLVRMITDVPSSIVLQFAMAFGVWILADEIHLSAIVTLVAFAITAARITPESTPPQLRLPSYAVWETSVFVLNVLAFVLIGLQVRPILAALDPDVRIDYLQIAAAVLGIAVFVRIAWVLTYNRIAHFKTRWFGAGKWPGEYRPTLRGSTVVSWCGMRGIVTLATAYALPLEFPHRDLALLCAFTVVVGTLIVQGLTLRPLILAMKLSHDGAVEKEIHLAREALAMVAAEVLDGDGSETAAVLRVEFVVNVEAEEDGTVSERRARNDLRARILAAQRRALVRLRDTQQIGDDAFHRIEERLDWAEVNVR
ncbi:MAG TPA: cation:proton antiporter, partial [Steroidobacteraceae bacterium]|nr:cation:proton antiporter [Steroidobacteraceae bacterium]